jgi:pantetheine-phosphate adenylyltransferase
MERIAVFPGSFDPFTIGHESIVRRAFPMFDRIVIAVGQNVQKDSYFPLDKKMLWIKEVFAGDPQVSVDTYRGLTVSYCGSINATFILRGLRTAADFEYERAIAQVNKTLHPEIETIFLLTLPEHSAINSSIVRDIIRNGGNASPFLPAAMNLQG